MRSRFILVLGRTLVLGGTLLTTGCGGSDRPGRDPLEEAGPSVRTEVLISTADSRIGAISDLVLDGEGTLYAVDAQSSQIHVVEGPDSVRSLSGPGAGPGELSRPHTLRKRGDTLFVVDVGNGRLQGLSPSGEPLSTGPVPPGYPSSLGSDGRFVRPTLGADSSLAVIHASDLSVIAPIGRIVGEPSGLIRMKEIKDQIRKGEVPDFLLNTARTVVGDAGETWLYVPARGVVQLFDPSGEETSSVDLEEPEREMLFQRFMSENDDRPANSIADLGYITDATVVGEDLWVLLGHSRFSDAAVRIAHPDGSLGARIDFPGVVGASQLAVDVDRGFAYFALQDVAALVRVALDDPNVRTVDP